MSTGLFRTALVMNLLLLLFSVALVHSDQSTVPLRSFTISGNVTYDCIDIYKQPGLDHPLLKTHKIQMQPTISRSELKNQTSNNKTYKKETELCPDGTVPILRNTKEFITNAQLFAEKNIHPLIAGTPGTHVAGIKSNNGPFRGVEASFSGHKLYVEKHEASYDQIYIGSNTRNEVNFVQAGFMINPSVHGDKRVWTYGYWKGRYGKACYNVACPGFIQISSKIPIVKPIDLKPGEEVRSRYTIHQDARTRNWWLTRMMPDRRNIDIGYWPQELFNLLDNGGNIVGVGGVAEGYLSGGSPPMGNGQFPIGDYKDSAIFSNIQVVNSNYQLVRIDSFPLEKLLDSTCYGLRIGERLYHDPRGYFFNYGGPGGRYCGV